MAAQMPCTAGSTVPLGFVSLLETVMMAGMAVVMVKMA